MPEIKYKKITDFDIKGKKLVVRVDMNSGIDLDKMEIREGADLRIKAVVPTLEKLKEAAVVLIAHQSRYGKPDCIDLKLHAERLDELYDGTVKFVDDLFGEKAQNAIKELQPGEVLVLNNVRQWKKETNVKSIEEAEDTELIKNLSPLFDYYVHDAFGAAHRAQVSLVGWPSIVAGPIVEEELEMVQDLLDPEKPCVWVVGGAKAIDKFKAVRYNLEEENIDKALIAGLTASLMQTAKGIDLGPKNKKFIEDDLEGNEEEIKEVCEKYPENLVFPVDLAYEENGERKEAATEKIAELDVSTGDIGEKTIGLFKKEIEKAKTIVSNGPPGIFEEEVFQKGSFDIVEALGKAADSGAKVVIGGGEMGTVAQQSEYGDKVTVSTGGGSLLSILSGKDVPMLKVLRDKMPEE